MLGVDFMSENVRAILDESGHADVQVRTATSSPRAGCGCGGGSALRPITYACTCVRAPTLVHIFSMVASARDRMPGLV